MPCIFFFTFSICLCLLLCAKHMSCWVQLILVTQILFSLFWIGLRGVLVKFFITREWVSSARSNFVLVKERPVVYLYFVTRQWRNTAIWTLVKSAPTQNLMPPPKAMKYLDAPFISPPCKQINLRYILLITKFIIRAFNCFVSHRCPPRTKEITRV